LVDFTIPAATLVLAEQCAAHGLVHIIAPWFTPKDEKSSRQQPAGRIVNPAI